MTGDDIKRFVDEWEMTLSGIRKMPEDDYLEAMFRAQVERHPGLREDIAYYERLRQGHVDKSYGFLMSAARRYIEHKRNHQIKIERARIGGKPSAAAVGNRPLCCAFSAREMSTWPQL